MTVLRYTGNSELQLERMSVYFNEVKATVLVYDLEAGRSSR